MSPPEELEDPAAPLGEAEPAEPVPLEPVPEEAPPAAEGEAPEAPPAAEGEAPEAPPAAGGEAPEAPPAAGGEAPEAPPAAEGEAPEAPPAAGGEAPEAPPAAEGEAGAAPPAAALGDGEARIVAVPGTEPPGDADVEFEAGFGLLDADEPEAALEPPRLTSDFPGHVPVGATGAAPEPAFCRPGPGSGNSKSALSTVLQPLPIFATNMAGKEASRLPKMESLVASYSVLLVSRLTLEPPPVTVIGAQFMYISRLPILLNQVHARV